MEEKIKRFVELSKEFTINVEEIFEYQSQYATVNYSISGTLSTNCCTSNQAVTKTRLEILKENANKEVKRAERFEEYLKLQADLLEYYNALEKLQ